MANVDYFLKIAGIAGESTDEQHKDELDVLSWSWGVSQTGTMAHGGGGGEGKANFSDFNFTHHVDRSSPVLMKACATGQHIKEATLSARKSGGETQQVFLKLTISDVLVSSYRNSGATVPTRQTPTDAVLVANIDAATTGEADLPMDAVSLRYAAAKLVEGPQTHIDVRPAATGVLAFDTKTGDWTLSEGGEGGLAVGTEGGVVHRAVQKFDVADLKALLAINAGTLSFSVDEVRPQSEEKSPPDPNLHFDVILFPTDDSSIGPIDLKTPGDRIGSLHVDPRGDPATLDVDITDLVLDRILIGLRVELRGTPIDVDPSEPNTEAAVSADQTASGDVVLKGRNILINFTTALSFDTR